MAVSIKIVTSNHVTRQFYQSNAENESALIHKLKNNSHLFTLPSLIITSDLQTEMFAPKNIVAIEVDSHEGEKFELPYNDMYFQAMDSGDEVFAFDLDFETDTNSDASTNVPRRARVEFYFQGGHAVTTELVLNREEASLAERTNRITQAFEQPIIYYQTENNGLGLFNPHAMTRAIITPRILVTPTDTIIVDEY